MITLIVAFLNNYWDIGLSHASVRIYAPKWESCVSNSVLVHRVRTNWSVALHGRLNCRRVLRASSRHRRWHFKAIVMYRSCPLLPLSQRSSVRDAHIALVLCTSFLCAFSVPTKGASIDVGSCPSPIHYVAARKLLLMHLF